MSSQIDEILLSCGEFIPPSLKDAKASLAKRMLELVGKDEQESENREYFRNELRAQLRTAIKKEFDI